VSRLLVICEGQTEEDFVKEILREYLGQRDWHSVSARLMGNARQRSQRGGIKGWPTVRKEIIQHLKQDPHCYVTTLVDYDGLPDSGEKAWPGRANSTKQPYREKGAFIEAHLVSDLQNALGKDQPVAERFIPFVLVHEFEALCFADPSAFCTAIGKPELAAPMLAIRQKFPSPEAINDNPETAPSERILQHYPAYQKPLVGNLGLTGVNFETIRAECAHFSAWIGQLEQLSE